jgi:hypothetical protein
MVSLIDVVRLLRTEFPDEHISPIEFPLTAPVAAITVDFSSSTSSLASVFNAEVSIIVRDEHPSLAEATSQKFRKFLDKKTNYILGDSQVVMSSAQNPIPLFIGKDDNDGYLYSNNFTLIINELG